MKQVLSRRAALLSWLCFALAVPFSLSTQPSEAAPPTPRLSPPPAVSSSVHPKLRFSINSLPRLASTLGGAEAIAPPFNGPKLSVETRVSRQEKSPGEKSLGGSSGIGQDANLSSDKNAQGPLPFDLSQVKRLRVAGKLVDETPIRVGNVDVLAPIVGDNSSILSTLGATATRVGSGLLPPGSSTQSFQINRRNAEPIVMTLSSANAYRGRESVALRAAPVVIAGKIWLPVFSMAQLLGASARLDAQTGTLYLNPTLQSVDVFPARGYTVVTVQTSAPVADGTVLMGRMENPSKIYFTFSDFSMGFDAAGTTGERVVSPGYDKVQQVRGGLFQSFPDKTRVVLDLAADMDATVQSIPEKNLFAIILSPARNANEPPPPIKIDEPQDVPEPQPIGTSDTLRGVTVVVDAGHGGHDGGASGSKSNEKTHTLDIARRLRSELQKRGANVLMTRDGDYFIPLEGRTSFANARNADIFCSVHINSFRSTSRGTETFYYTGQSLPLAREVHAELRRATGLPNRGVSQARFFVIRKTEMPSILTETCFISNPSEEKLLLSADFRQKVARAMAQGISNYHVRYGRR